MISTESKAWRTGMCIGLFIGVVSTWVSPWFGVPICIVIFMLINPLLDFLD